MAQYEANSCSSFIPPKEDLAGCLHRPGTEWGSEGKFQAHIQQWQHD